MYMRVMLKIYNGTARRNVRFKTKRKYLEVWREKTRQSSSGRGGLVRVSW